MTKEAIALDPDYADAYTLLGYTHFMDAIFSWSQSKRQSMGRAMKLAQKAITMNDSLSGAHTLLGYIYTFTRQYEKGITECQQGITFCPNSEAAYRALGQALRYSGKWKEAVPVYEKAFRLNPFPPSSLFWHLGMSYIFTGQTEEAVISCKKAVEANPKDLPAHLALTFSYIASGRGEEAQATAKEILRIDPQFSVDNFSKKTLTYKNPADAERFAAALRKAGLN